MLETIKDKPSKKFQCRLTDAELYYDIDIYISCFKARFGVYVHPIEICHKLK